jgi:shikimate dehydrogenase
VGHSVSPAMCAAGFAALGLPHSYTAVDVPSAAGLGRLVDDLRSGVLAGCNVTVPYKRAVLDHVDVRAESVEEAGAANVLMLERGRGVVAHNTDAEALARDLEAVLGQRPRLRAAIIGAGGAGLAAVVACRRLGFKVICMTSRSWINTEIIFNAPSAQRARALGALAAPWPQLDEAAAVREGASGPASRPQRSSTTGSPVEPPGKLTQALRLQWSELVAHADCIIQATSAGMVGGGPGEDVSSVVAWDRLPAHAVAYDVVYNPRVTPFLRAARGRGMVAVDGLGMLVRQAALAIALWTGLTPPLDRMREAAEDALDGARPRR